MSPHRPLLRYRDADPRGGGGLPNPYYILEGHTVLPLPDVRAWGLWMDMARRQNLLQVGLYDQPEHEARVSTVFLGLDHRFGDGGRPIVFETMIFGGAEDQAQWRYCSWAEAIAGHARAVALARRSERPKVLVLPAPGAAIVKAVCPKHPAESPLLVVRVPSLYRVLVCSVCKRVLGPYGRESPDTWRLFWPAFAEGRKRGQWLPAHFVPSP